MIDNTAFRATMEKYKPSFYSWYNHVRKYISVDRDSFLCEFQFVLFKSMLHFDKEKSTAGDKHFERYFISALHKHVKTLKRDANTIKRQVERTFIPFSISKHDMVDSRAVPACKRMEIIDLIQFCYRSPKDRDIVVSRLMGKNKEEICSEMSMSKHEYRKRISAIKNNSILREQISY